MARQYKVPLWSDAHFRLIDRSLAQLARIGNDWWFVPIILRTEFGNDEDCPIRTIRKADGTLAFDFSVVDRYLDLAIKHWGVPRCICFGVLVLPVLWYAEHRTALLKEVRRRTAEALRKRLQPGEEEE